MHYIQSDRLSGMLKVAEPLDIEDGWEQDTLVKKADYPVIEHFDSGDDIDVSSGEWEEIADLYSVPGGQLLLRVQEVYWGQCHGDKEPRWYSAKRVDVFGYDADAV